MERLAREFFALPEAEKAEIAMKKGGKVQEVCPLQWSRSKHCRNNSQYDHCLQAWRGWFPLGDEFTSGLRDGKAGIYFGTESTQEGDCRPLHGRNLMPKRPQLLGEAVLEYMERATALGQALLRGIAMALGLDASYFESSLTRDPTVLFRIFHYPPSDQSQYPWGVGEHTDYGLLTLLCVDRCGGLQVKHKDGHWLDVPPPPEGSNAIIVNLGDMLDRITKGRYRSTPHRVANVGMDRISFPLFLDPGWDQVVDVLPIEPTEGGAERWDGADLGQWRGTHGEYLVSKVSKCFPELFGESVARAGLG